MSLVKNRIPVQEPYHFIKLNHFTMISLLVVVRDNCFLVLFC